MLKTCKYCGIVPEDHICPYRKHRNREHNTVSDKFHKTRAWTEKSKAIRERDKYLCLVCLANKYNTINQLNYKNLEVHHIVPIKEDYEQRLNDNNLITLCNYHHQMAEAGKIPREELLELVQKQYE